MRRQGLCGGVRGQGGVSNAPVGMFAPRPKRRRPGSTPSCRRRSAIPSGCRRWPADHRGSQTCAVAARRGRPATAGAHCCLSLTGRRAAGHAVPAIDSMVHCPQSHVQARGMVSANESAITLPPEQRRSLLANHTVVGKGLRCILARHAPGHLSCACRPCLNLPRCPVASSESRGNASWPRSSVHCRADADLVRRDSRVDACRCRT